MQQGNNFYFSPVIIKQIFRYLFLVPGLYLEFRALGCSSHFSFQIIKNQSNLITKLQFLNQTFTFTSRSGWIFAAAKQPWGRPERGERWCSSTYSFTVLLFYSFSFLTHFLLLMPPVTEDGGETRHNRQRPMLLVLSWLLHAVCSDRCVTAASSFYWDCVCGLLRDRTPPASTLLLGPFIFHPFLIQGMNFWSTLL